MEDSLIDFVFAVRRIPLQNFKESSQMIRERSFPTIRSERGTTNNNQGFDSDVG